MAKNKRLILITTGLAVVLVLAAVIAFKSDTSAPSPSQSSTETGVVARVEVTDSGFTPATLKVKVGTNVVWTNKGKNVRRIVSNPHPSHDGLSGLDSKTNIATNGTYSYKFTATGNYGYHDENNPTLNGVIVVEQ